MPPWGEGTRTRKPRGYFGKGHETIGSDILAVVQILKMPEQVLGADEVQKLARVRKDDWYPIEWLLDLMEKVDKELGHYGLLQMGRRLFALSHEERLVRVARSAADVIYGIDGMYHHANRGMGIGGWKVVRFDAGYAELEKTTPHHCVMEQGILSSALSAVKCPGMVSQKQCFRQGAEACLFVITSSFTDERWFGSRTPSTTMNERPSSKPGSKPRLKSDFAATEGTASASGRSRAAKTSSGTTTAAEPVGKESSAAKTSGGHKGADPSAGPASRHSRTSKS